MFNDKPFNGICYFWVSGKMPLMSLRVQGKADALGADFSRADYPGKTTNKNPEHRFFLTVLALVWPHQNSDLDQLCLQNVKVSPLATSTLPTHQHPICRPLSLMSPTNSSVVLIITTSSAECKIRPRPMGQPGGLISVTPSKPVIGQSPFKRLSTT